MNQKPFCFSVKAVVANQDGEYLVIRRSMLAKNNGGGWDLPGGKCDPGESLDVALRREVAEETGLDVCLTCVLGAGQSELPDRVVAYVFVEARSSAGEVTLSEEHTEHRWLPLSELASLAIHEPFSKFLREFAARRTNR